MPSHLGTDPNVRSRRDLHSVRLRARRPSLLVESLERRLLLSAQDLRFAHVFVGPLPAVTDTYTAVRTDETPSFSQPAKSWFTYAISTTWRMSADFDSLPSAKTFLGDLTTPGEISPAQALVTETASPHNALESAQPIPYARNSVLTGSLSPNDRLDLYRVPLDSDTVAIQITLKAVAPSTELPGRVWLIDELGHIIGDWSIPKKTATMTLNLRAVRQPQGSSLVYGISHGTGARPHSSEPGFSYEVEVTRLSATEAETAPRSGPIVTLLPPPGPALPSMPGVTNELQPQPSSDLPVQSPALPPVASAPPSGTSSDMIHFATLPLPTRTAGPSGGWFADGDPIPPLDRLDAALVDVKLLDILPSSLARSRLLEMRGESEHDLDAFAPPLVALQSAGGFPLLAAALTGSLLRSPDNAVAELPALPAVDSTDLLATSGEPAVSGCHTSPAPSPTQDRSKSRGSVLVTLNIAATLAFGLLLPDLIAALQSVEPRRPLLRTRLPRRPWRTAD